MQDSIRENLFAKPTEEWFISTNGQLTEDPTLCCFKKQIYRKGNECLKYGPNKGQMRTPDKLTGYSTILYEHNRYIDTKYKRRTYEMDLRSENRHVN